MIDIKTFMLVLAIGNIGLAMLMAGYARSQRHPAMRIWSWSKLVVGFAYLLGWLQGPAPSPWHSISANTLVMLGITLEVAAYCTFFGFIHWKRVLYPLGGLSILVYVGVRLSGAPLPHATAFMSSVIAVMIGTMAFVLLRPGGESSLLRRIIGVNDAVFFLAMSARALSDLMPDSFTLLTPHAAHAFTFITGYLLVIVNGFGFLLLCKEKDDREMALLATTDSLTGLVNRRAFFERTDAARMLSARLRKPISLMMLDIDHFKALNDRFGHACGDEALCVFADTSRGVLREHDIMGRLGGEEFALALPGTDLAGALQAAERLREAVERVILPKHGYAMTVSIGVVLIDPNEDINSALARADQALYQAKSGGRNRVESGEPILKFG
ncbi:GGDEF domain-containing protein [Massilia sp. RP-1-19]|uniref:diguanylate cyclase n=1 Tax=Massilia polaris TaxID=2728846 RepID=A0A848HGQ9_9BURK|nr:GGDEF domain-containing protein [Massilia polaris]